MENILDTNRSNIKRAKQISHSKERTLNLARKFAGTNFYDTYSPYYIHAFRNGYIYELQKVLGEKKQKEFSKQKKRTLNLAKKCTGDSFTIKYHTEYNHASYHGYLNELNKILDLQNKIYRKNKKSEILKLASEYRGNSFFRDFQSEYECAVRYNFVKEMKNILDKNRPKIVRAKRIAHSKEITINLAREFKGEKFRENISEGILACT